VCGARCLQGAVSIPRGALLHVSAVPSAHRAFYPNRTSVAAQVVRKSNETCFRPKADLMNGDEQAEPRRFEGPGGPEARSGGSRTGEQRAARGSMSRLREIVADPSSDAVLGVRSQKVGRRPKAQHVDVLDNFGYTVLKDLLLDEAYFAAIEVVASVCHAVLVLVRLCLLSSAYAPVYLYVFQSQ
jgi:hypothetical protein